MNKLFLIALMLTLVGCDKSGGGGGDQPAKVVIPEDEIVGPPAPEPFDPDVEYPDAQPLPIGVVIPPSAPIPTPEEPDYSDTCVEVTWVLPTERVNGVEFNSVEVANILVVRQVAPADAEESDVWSLIYDHGTLEERIVAGDPLISFIPPTALSANCDDLGLARGDYLYWYGVAVIDTDGQYSDASEMVYPNF